MRSFFGECDRKDGKIVNTNPLWTKDKVISDMKESVDSIERQEEEGMIIGGAKARALKKARKDKLKKTLSQIDASNPVGKVKGKDLDNLKTAVDSFVEEIKDKNPTHYDDDMAIRSGKSTINPRKQGNYSKRPCIILKNEAEVEMAKACNMRIDEKNMVSKDDMTRGVWLMQQCLGIQPDHNQLKHDKPRGHIADSNRVTVLDLPGDMQVAHENHKKDRKMALSQGK